MGQIRRLSWALRLGGAGVCLVGVFGFVSGFWIQFPSAVEGVMMLSIPIAIGGFLLASGALLGRAATRREELEERRRQAALGVGTVDDHIGRADRERDRERVPARRAPPHG